MLLLLQRSGLEHALRPFDRHLRRPETFESLVRAGTNANQIAVGNNSTC